MPIVDLQNLTKYYKKNRGIVDVTFSIEEGEIFGFIGPNGAGKSTAIRTLLNFIYPTSGSATIFGYDIVAESRQIRQKVGYLPAEIHYYDDMRVIDLLRYSARFYHLENSDKRIRKLADRLDLDLRRKIEDLSFGNRKKTGIAQAMLHEPRLLILDEPTGGLDPLMQNVFFDMLEEERNKGVTIFFSSHVLNEVQKMCDRVAIIKEGELVAIETIDHLTSNQFKRITLNVPHPKHFSLNLAGVFQQEITSHQVTLLYQGETNALLQALANEPVQDILIEEPSLSEVFMHFYEKGGDVT